jgi:hypothetical protein
MATRENIRRELKELAKLGETLRTDRVADPRSSGEWSYLPPNSEASLPPDTADVQPAAAVRGAHGITSSGVICKAETGPTTAELLEPYDDPEPTTRRGGATRWALAVAGAVLVVGGALVSRSRGIHRAPTAAPIVIATQAAPNPATPAAVVPQADETASDDTLEEGTKSVKSQAPGAAAGVSASPSPVPSAASASEVSRPAHAPMDRSPSVPAVHKRTPNAGRAQGAPGAASLEDLMRQSVRNDSGKK